MHTQSGTFAPAKRVARERPLPHWQQEGRSIQNSVDPMSRHRSLPSNWHWLLVIPSGLLLAWGLWFVHGTGFDGLYGQDPYSYYNYALGPLRDSLLRLQGPPSYFWPPGYPLLILLASSLAGPTPLAGQLVSLFSGALVPLATGLLASQIWPDSNDRWPIVPLIAAGSMAVVGQLWQSSMVVMSDTAGLAAATIGIWALARYGTGDQPRLPWLLAGTAAIASAVLIRWAYALVAVPALGYVIWVLARMTWPKRLLHTGLASLVSVAILWPLLPGAVQALTGVAPVAASFAGDLEVYRWNPGNALRTEFFTSDGHLSYRYPNGLYYLLLPAHPYYFTPWLAVLVLLGLWHARLRLARPSLLLLAGWPAVLYLFHAGAQWQNFRFALAYAPPLAILAAIGFDFARRHLGTRWGRPLDLYLLAGLALMTAGALTLTTRFVERKDADMVTVRWVQEQVPHNAYLLTLGLTLAVEHYTELEALDLYLLTPADLQALLLEQKPVYLLTDVASLETQWRDMAPGVNYRWLRQSAQLSPLGTHRMYQLFTVSSSTP
jgi:4-amino-4-deoxy-L-arabinose transferase-like glycosyltransferase